jgi:hypothetical protein
METGFEAQDRQEWARITRKLRQSLRDRRRKDGDGNGEEEKKNMRKRKMKSLVFMVL